MKHNDLFSLGIIAGIAFILPMSTFAKDQNRDEKEHDKKEASAQKHGGKKARQAEAQASTVARGKSDERNTHNSANGNIASSGKGRVGHVSTESAAVQRSNDPAVTAQKVQSGSRQQTLVYSERQQNQTRSYANQRSKQTQFYSSTRYNRANNYGGLWYPAHTHSNWSQNRPYYWNNHHYRWYNGGWLIIDAGFNPYNWSTGYGYGDSTASSVQMRLADEGYYRGPIDGDIGPGSRNAIANYQGDYGLRVTGRINDQLLRSMRL